MVEHFETMKDKIFQSEKLESLFKKYSTRENPCNITSFIKKKYGSKKNVVANMKVKVSRLINKQQMQLQILVYWNYPMI